MRKNKNVMATQIDISSLPSALYQARLAEIEAKARLLAAERDYKQTFSGVYVRVSQERKGAGHWMLLNRTNLDRDVQRAAEARDAAELQVLRTAADVEFYQITLNVAKLTPPRDALAGREAY